MSIIATIKNNFPFQNHSLAIHRGGRLCYSTMNSTMIYNSFSVVEKVLKLTYTEMKMDMVKKFNGEQYNELIDVHMETSYRYLHRTILSEMVNADEALDIVRNTNTVTSTDSPAMLSCVRLPVNEEMHEHFRAIESVLWLVFYELEVKLIGEIPRERYSEFISNELLSCFRHVHRAIVNELHNMDAVFVEYIANNDVAEVLATPPHESTSLSSPPRLRKKRRLQIQRGEVQETV